ncbi:Disease resistance-like protein DSC2 [Linum grandiflorum]
MSTYTSLHRKLPAPAVEEEHDVFLSFRGDDVRGKFVDHLYARLKCLGVNAFMDDKKMPRGEFIEKSILIAIQRSRISVVVLSPKFADSPWCLDELVKIVQCVKKGGHVAMPVFFHVSPHDIAGQSGAYEAAFRRHASVFPKKRVDKWRKALTAVAGISGWRFREHGSEAQLVEVISKEIRQTLGKIAVAKVDMITRIRSGGSKKSSDVSESSSGEEMNLFSYQVMEGLPVIRICGLDGVESTNSAKVVYDSVLGRREFFPDGHHRRSLGFHEQEPVQPDPELILSRRVWEKDGDIDVVRSSVKDKKILVIVDGVEKLANLLRLATGTSWLGSGSQVVISGVDVSKKVLTVVHINMEEGAPRGGGMAASSACRHCCMNKYVDIACFVKEKVNCSELMNRILNSLTAGGLPAEVVVKVRVERIENVGMVEDGKLDVKIIKYEEEPPANSRELKAVTHWRLMEASLVSCVVFFLTRITPPRKQPLSCPRSTPAIPPIRGLLRLGLSPDASLTRTLSFRLGFFGRTVEIYCRFKG